MKHWIRTVVAIACVLSGGIAAGQGASGFPSRPMRIVVAFPPGGSNDILARIVAQRMSETWNQPVVVENRPGANTIIAVEQVIKSPPDGHTLLVGASSTYTINPQTYAKLPYDPVRDLMPVTLMGSHPMVVAVHPSLAAKSIPELIALAKSRPGQINYGTPTVTFQVMVETFSQMAGVQLNHIPYKGSVPALTALIANDVQMIFIDPAPIVSHLRSGRVRGLAVTSPVRSPSVPELPTVAEAGLPGFEGVPWNGLFAPAGTPRDVIAKLQAEAHAAVHRPELRERLTGLGIDPVANTPEQFTELLRAEAARFATVVRAAKIKAE